MAHKQLCVGGERKCDRNTWYGQPDSNRHGLLRRILSPLRLPIPPCPQTGRPLYQEAENCKRFSACFYVTCRWSAER